MQKDNKKITCAMRMGFSFLSIIKQLFGYFFMNNFLTKSFLGRLIACNHFFFVKKKGSFHMEFFFAVLPF